MDTARSRLEKELRSRTRGTVAFDAGSRALYATDGSNYRQVPIGVVVPRDVEDIVAAVSVCRAHEAPVLVRGGGTSLAGQSCNAAVVLDTSRHVNRIVEMDPVRRLARVEPGLVLDDLRAAAEEHLLTFGPDPATHAYCTLGGMIGNNSCGVHSIMAGKTAENVEALDILTYDGLQLRVGATSEEELAGIIAAGGRRGEIYAGLRELRDRYAELIRERFPAIRRRVSGYNLDQLLPENGFNVARALVGSEGTCVTILEATVRLVQSPPYRTLAVLGYPDAYVAADHVPEILSFGPAGLEGFDDVLIEHMRLKNLHTDDIALLPEGTGWLLVEFGGETAEAATTKARVMLEALRRRTHAPSALLYEDPREAKRVWEVRESGLGATSFVPGQRPAWEGWEDAAVAPKQLGRYLRELRSLMERYGYRGALYGHYGDGCVHTRIDFDLVTAEGIATYRRFVREAAELVVAYGGSLSGEHGDGQSRAELLPLMFGPELIEAFRAFKRTWDPAGKMNPGKVVDAYRVDENLRLGVSYHPPQVRTHFAFPADNGSFGQAALRCVGVGKCRKHEAGTMCPSYMVTREERHSTRGRAHLLFEMLEGDPLRGGWRDDAVREALDLCLACKACKSECPVQVDMATYKAEFLSHYYARRLRPMSAYAMGWIWWWARLASVRPGLVNAVVKAPLLRNLIKRIGGIAPQRTLPVFAKRTFRHWFRESSHDEGGSEVMLWADTFTNYFHPEIGQAAVGVLEAAGYRVRVPERSLCCGRPLYDHGFLGQARRQLQQILRELAPAIRAGMPVVVLEPSCLAVFRDELRNLFPNDEDARRLSGQAVGLAELLQRDGRLERFGLSGRALVQGHCHQKAVIGIEDERGTLERLGLEVEVLDAGCCGMAGAFGFQREHYDVSIACGEQRLLPTVRAAAEETLVVADGFSCREQIAQTTERRAVHLAEVLQMGLRET